MTKAEAIAMLKRMAWEPQINQAAFEALDMAIEALSQESSEDLISRQAAIDALGDKPLAWTEGEYELGLQQQWEADVNAIKALPPAQLEHEYTMEEFMYGQDMGNPEDGSL